MDAAGVWVEYLREQAREMAYVASDSARLAREMVAAGYYGASLYQQSAHRAGIIAREAYRQWAAAAELMSDRSWLKMLAFARLAPADRVAACGAEGMQGVLLGLVGHEP